MSEYTREEILKLIEGNGGPEGLDLSGKDLSGIDLHWRVMMSEAFKARDRTPGESPVWYMEQTLGVNLKGANLQGAKLVGARLHRAFLGDANLKEANLRFAYLQEAILWVANLQGANLQYANLEKAHLERANLQEADLEGANLEWANLTDANLRGANLEDANLQEAILQGADLRGVRLQGTILRGAYLEGALRDWQAIPVTEGMLEVAFAITGITSALIGVVAGAPSFDGIPVVALLIPISLSAAASTKLYLSYLNQQGLHRSLRSFMFSPYGWLLLASGGAWLFAAFMILKQILTPN